MDLSRYMSALELGVKRIVLEINDEDEDDEIEIVSGPVEKVCRILPGTVVPCCLLSPST